VGVLASVQLMMKRRVSRKKSQTGKRFIMPRWIGGCFSWG
jgi:hypothetical protein